MAFIVEDGSVVSGANSYASVAESLDYHSDMGNSEWAALASDAIREQHLRKATAYMVQVYRSMWKGYRKSAVQTLDWPRQFVYLEPFVHGNDGQLYPYLVPDTIVPDEVKNACFELALRSVSGLLAPDLTRAQSEVKVGPIEVKYDENSSESPRYRAVDMALSIYLLSAPMNVKAIRR